MNNNSYTDSSYKAKGTDCNVADYLSPCVLMGDLQEAADIGAAQLGSDTTTINDMNCCWIVLRMSLKVERMPKWKENFTIRTWSTGFDKLYFNREYEIYDENSNKIGLGSSVWIIADNETHRPVRPTSLPMISGTMCQNPKRVFEQGSPKLSFPKDKSMLGEAIMLKFADYSELDHNRHVNNTRYVAWAHDVLHKIGIDPSIVKEFDINYNCEVKDSERVELYTYEEDGFIYVVGYKDIETKVFIFRTPITKG